MPSIQHATLKLLLVMGLLSGCHSRALAQQPVETQAAINELQVRMEALEMENWQLRQSLDRLPATTPVSTVNTELLNEPAIHNAVETYLSEHNDYAGDYGDDLWMSATWNNGLELSTADKAFRVHVGGRTQFDAGWFSVDPNLYTPAGGPTAGLDNTYGDGADFRRARLRIDGTMYENIEWVAEYDLVNSATLGADSVAGPGHLSNQPRMTPVPTDLWWTFKELPVIGNLRIGNQKEAMGFEHLVSSRFQPFMERSYNQDSFYGGLFNGFLPGIQAFDNYGECDMGVWQLGLFKPSNNVFAFNTGDGDYALTGRVTRLLCYADDGARLLHVGASARQATAVSQAIGSNGSTTVARSHTFRTRDAIRTGLTSNWPTPANITIFGDDEQTLNAELVGVFGSWTWQSEYLVNSLQDAQARSAATGLPVGPVVGNALYHGGYFQLLYFLTGEHDHYNKKTGTFERVTPHENFWRGAWQVGARYNYLDLNDEGLNGGILHDITGGVNWFLNPNMKVQFNYIATYRDAPLAAAGGIANPGDGWVHGWGIRVAHDF
ncbi:MAG: hypothetical protein HYV60_16175 [Planctomycetia bacterium]|nr:hypothetical protein [Planctomycetia bacterium]